MLSTITNVLNELSGSCKCYCKRAIPYLHSVITSNSSKTKVTYLVVMSVKWYHRLVITSSNLQYHYHHHRSNYHQIHYLMISHCRSGCHSSHTSVEMEAFCYRELWTKSYLMMWKYSAGYLLSRGAFSFIAYNMFTSLKTNKPNP